MGTCCSAHQHNEYKLQDNVQQLSNTMLRMQMFNLGQDSRAALDLRWFLESNPAMQQEYLTLLEKEGIAIKHLLLNCCICSGIATDASMQQSDSTLLHRLGQVIGTNLTSLETLEVWHVCPSNLQILKDILSQVLQIKTLKFECGIKNIHGRRNANMLPVDAAPLDLTNHRQLTQVELMGFQDVHLQTFFQSTAWPATILTLMLSCDALVESHGNDDIEGDDDAMVTRHAKISASVLERIFGMPALEHLILSGLSLEAKGPAHLFCKLLQQSKLQSLSMSSCYLREQLADVFVESMLTRTTTLSKVHLNFYSSDENFPVYLDSFAKHVPKSATIKELVLATFYEGEEDYSHYDLLAFLGGAARAQGLEVLGLPWVKGWTSALSDAVHNVMRQCKHLRALSINMYGNNLDPDAPAILSATFESSSIERVKFVPPYKWTAALREAIEKKCKKNRECHEFSERFQTLLQEPLAKTRAAVYGTALVKTLDKKHVVFQSLVVAANMLTANEPPATEG
ncbi:hypothetical protein MPSEU_000111100 [Mayamaea pseudoterrestris]|nr:hypothetical protein MPSEU_000111100 [Mayamaea pseudoterrestris]